MIYIENNSLNKIFVDVSYATGNTPNFLWSIQNSQGMNVKNFIPRDITATYPSQYAGKYKVFEFSTIPTLPENLTPTGTSVVNIYLPNLNQFWIEIYEQPGIVNLDPNNAVKVLNSLGFCFVDETQEYYTGNTLNTADNVIYYQGGSVIPSPTPTQTSSPTPTPTGTPQPSSSPTPTPTPTITETSTPTPTPTITETPTQTPTPTSSNTPTPTETPSPTPTPSATNPQLWNLGGGFDNIVYGITPLYDGVSGTYSYWITGRFNSYDGYLSSGIVKVDKNGNYDPNFVGRKQISISQQIYEGLPLTGDTMLLAGNFLSYDGFANCNRFVKINSNTGAAVDFTGTTFNSDVFGFTPTQLGKIIAFGAFTTFTGSPYQRIIRFNNDLSVDNTYWNSATNFNQQINQVIEGITGNYVVVGAFDTYKGVSQNRIVEIDHTTGNKTALFGTGSASATLRDIKTDSSGNYYILSSSQNNNFNGTIFTGQVLFKVSSAGVVDTSWNGGIGTTAVPGNIYLDEINGWIYIMGTAPDYPRRIDLSTGVVDTAWTSQQQLTFGSQSTIGNKNIYRDNNTNKVLIGNAFTIIQGQPYNRFIRLNPDGTSNTTTT